jgi:sugar phosphate isomerase/epimerase
VRSSVCSYSFHRSFDEGSMDLDGYIAFCRDAGFTELDVWSRHIGDGDEERLRDSPVPVGSIAVDGADAWAPTEEERAANRERAERWLDLAAAVGAKTVRFNAGPFHYAFEPGSGTEAEFAGVVAGFKHLVDYGSDRSVDVVTENHWGPFQHPDELDRLLDAVPGLGLLFDTNNWPEGTREAAWERYAPRARTTHFKTVDARAVELLRNAGYDGCWGIEIEGLPPDADERAAVVDALARLRGLVEGNA